MTEVLSQYEWLLLQLEPEESVALQIAKAAMAQWIDDTPTPAPLFWLSQPIVSKELSVASILLHGFMWCESPQGHEYWNAVYTRYLDRETGFK